MIGKICYTSLKYLSLALKFHISSTNSLSFQVGQLNQLFNKQAFALSGFHGFVVAAGCLFIPYQMFAQSINIDGLDQQSMYFIGTAIAGIVTIVVNFQVGKSSSF